MDHDGLKAFFQKQSQEIVVAFAARAALRAFPLLTWAPPNPSKTALRLTGPHNIDLVKIGATLRLVGTAALFAATVSSDLDKDEMRYHARAPYEEALAAGAYSDGSDAAATSAVHAAVACYAANAAAAADDAASAVIASHSIAAYAAAAAAIADQRAIDLGITVDAFLCRPLWPDETPTWFTNHWKHLRAELLARKEGWELWVDWFEARVRGVAVDPEVEKRRLFHPGEIWAQPAKDRNAYIKRQLAPAIIKTPLNRVRVILIGRGTAGKTSVVKALFGDPVIEGKEEATQGIAPRESRPEDVGVLWQETLPKADRPTAIFWDFGGQAVAHQTHQFFLRSGCVYVLVLDTAREDDANREARYWLEHIRAYGGDSPVLIVANKSDKPLRTHIDLPSLCDLYKDVRINKQLFPVSCTEAQSTRRYEFDRFVAALVREVKAMNTATVALTPGEHALLSDLRSAQAGEHFLPKKTWVELCAKHKVGKDGLSRDALLRLFDTLGLVIHFDKLDSLDDYLLNPEWLTQGVYAIMFSKREELKRSGRLSKREIAALLAARNIVDTRGRAMSYSPARVSFLVDAMREFKLCFPLHEGEHDEIIVPGLLDGTWPVLDFDHDKAWTFRFRFDGTMPRHILPSLLVDRYFDIVEDGNGERKMCKFGAHMRPRVSWGEANALVSTDEIKDLLTITAYGRDGQRFVDLLRERVLAALDKMPDVEYDEEVELTADMALPGQLRAGRMGSTSWIYYDNVRDAVRRQEATIRERGVEYSLGKITARMPPGRRDVVVIEQSLDDILKMAHEHPELRRDSARLAEIDKALAILRGAEGKPEAEQARAREDAWARLDPLLKWGARFQGASGFIQALNWLRKLLGF